ncbi:HD domain-containing protein [Dactylosporangium sp. NPDC005555]|uniref:HD domain-containing protein n=1 Tax=Dactylosporangium sp. NPDC005555 TaxID=3154889 RepID=UPI0033A67E43
MWVPSEDEIRALHERHAPDRAMFDLVWTHCTIVWQVARQLLERTDAQPDLVRAGCLVHDIGVYRLREGEHYIRHGLLGHELLREEGLPEVLCRFCSCHTGVGITLDDVARQGLPIPPGDYVAVSEEERLVMYADKFHSKSSPPRFVTAEEYRGGVARFGADKVALFDAMLARYGEPDLTAIRP